MQTGQIGSRVAVIAAITFSLLLGACSDDAGKVTEHLDKQGKPYTNPKKRYKRR